MAKKKSKSTPKNTKTASNGAKNGESMVQEEVKNNNPENEATEAQPLEGLPEADEVLELQATITQLEETVAEKEKAVQEANGKYLRLMAEFDNFRKRTRKEKGDMIEYAAEDVLVALLPVLDNFDRTLIAIEKTDNLASIKDGIKLVTDNMHRVLKNKGLSQIECAGQEFDSELHEALGSFEVPEEEKKGKVLEEVEKGYKLKDKVIRYSKVIVGE